MLTVQKKPRSLKKHILQLFLEVCVPTMLLLGFFLVSNARESNREAGSKAQRELSMFCSTVSLQMDAAENLLLDLAGTNAAFRSLEDRMESTEAYLALQDLRSSVMYALNTNPQLSGIVIYAQNNALCVGVYNRMGGESGQEQLESRLEMEKSLSALTIAQATNTAEWYLRSVGGRQYLLRTVQRGNVYLNAFFDLELLCEAAREVYSLPGRVQICSTGGDFLAGSLSDFIESMAWPDSDGFELRSESGRIAALVRQTVGNIVFHYGAEITSYVGSVTSMQIIMILAMLTLLTAIPFLFYYINKTVFLPMNMLMDTMNRISAGELSARPNKDLRNLELIRVNETFNHMIEQITQLKIDSYEQQLEAERGEMRALKFQIRPHFILNCLKQVYALAELGSMQDVQAMTLRLSRHLRYILSYTDDTIPLSEELEQCRNYADLCSIGRTDPVYFTCYTEPCLENMQLPTVSLLTFVENSIKHGRRSGKVLQINIMVRLLQAEEGNIANITVGDNGGGFTEEELEQMNRQEQTEENGYHVGLANVLRRLRFQYGNEVAVAYANNRSGGAQIELFIPMGHAGGVQ